MPTISGFNAPTSTIDQFINSELNQADAAVKEAEADFQRAKAKLKSAKEHRDSIGERLSNSIVEQFKAIGITVSVRGLTKKTKSTSSPLPPKFRNPAAGETWSGRGNKPKWAEGYDLKDSACPLLISNQTSDIES